MPHELGNVKKNIYMHALNEPGKASMRRSIMLEALESVSCLRKIFLQASPRPTNPGKMAFKRFTYLKRGPTTCAIIFSHWRHFAIILSERWKTEHRTIGCKNSF
jgi:hypothetical protein